MTSPLRILLVEDDAGHAALFERSLGRAGVDHELTVHEDGEDALASLRSGPGPDLVVVDLRLPRMDGLTLLHQIRGDQGLAEHRVAVLTTSAESEEEAACRDLGVVGFLTKPITPEAVQRLVDVARG